MQSPCIIHFRRSIDWPIHSCVMQLLNQLDEAGSGAPPASTEQIDALPTVSIIQSQVGELRLLYTSVMFTHMCSSFITADGRSHIARLSVLV